eukprot:CAMPEP_0119052446 /NCGR_PEP_ID=MMETSP1177-20130426/73743_1 /TAXON_ID=2985 /ORGANISM="Ochromonas sp, Strain CCMP1899" /LENGTH=533 /DNA_ID=CAMNT_0007032019 /DNA_START=18 /DNA_END=1619 /DNA_ORIENTATION=-
MSALMLACLYGRISVVKVLLSFNADYRVLDSSQSNLLHYAARGGNYAVEIFETLRSYDRNYELEKKKLEIISENEFLAELNKSERTRNSDMVRTQNIDMVNEGSVKNNDGILKGLLNMRDILGNTPLHNACDSKQIDMAKVLVLFGSDINAQTTNKNDHKEKNKKEQNEKEKDEDYTAILSDESHNSIKSVIKRRSVGSLQVNVQASPIIKELNLINSKNQYEEDDVSYDRINDAIINNLKSKLIRKIDDSEDATSKTSSPPPGLLAPVWGITPLHIAVKKRLEELVIFLMESNANPLLTDSAGVSPYDLAKKLRADSPIFICINKKALFRLSETTEHVCWKESKGTVVACDPKNEMILEDFEKEDGPLKPHPKENDPSKPHPKEDNASKPHPKENNASKPHPKENDPSKPHPKENDPSKPHPKEDSASKPHPKEDGFSKPQLVDKNDKITDSTPKMNKQDHVSHNQKFNDINKTLNEKNESENTINNVSFIDKRDSIEGDKKGRIDDLISGEIDEYVFKMIRSVRELVSTES